MSGNTPWMLGLGVLVGASAGYWLVRWKDRNVRAALALREKNILEQATREAEAISREARLKATEEALKIIQQSELQVVTRTRDVGAAEQRLNEREKLLNRQLENLVEQERTQREAHVRFEADSARTQALRADLEKELEKRRQELSRLAHLSEAEAKAAFLKEVEQSAQKDAGQLTRSILDQARLQGEEKARRIVSIAIQRYAGEHTFETSTATVAIPTDEALGNETKGRIIGREGRNIRAFEAATGITVLIDDTPGVVVLSGFDPVRREIARQAMERLIADGRIHPTRIEEVVTKVSQEIDEELQRVAEEAVHKVGLPPLHPEIVKLLGRLRFRHSFSQNILHHSVEVAHLAGLMAMELGADVPTAKRAGLLHDIGKALTQEASASHALAGAEFLRGCGEPAEVINGVAAHHDEIPHTGIYGILVGAADSISASRPGARSETMTTHLKRMEDLERIGLSFPGVEKCYAVQAGRELRIIVQPDQVNDEQAFLLARNVARCVEEQLQYPGQIRVTVMRETRCVEFAK